MRTSLLFLGAAMVGIATSNGSVSAQSVGVYVGPAYDDYYYYDDYCCYDDGYYYGDGYYYEGYKSTDPDVTQAVSK